MCDSGTVSRLLKPAHLRRPSLRLGTPRTRALAAPFDGLRVSGSRDAWIPLRWVPRPGYPSVRMGDAALHLDQFEQPARKLVLQHPVGHRPRGAALIISMLIMAVLLLAGTTFMTISSTESQIALNETSLVRAFHAAESALFKTIVILNGNSGYTGTSGTLASGVTYTASVTTPASQLCPTSDARTIAVRGSVNVQGALALVDLSATVSRISYPFRFAAFSTVPNGIEGGTRLNSELLFDNDAVTDSFDSSLLDATFTPYTYNQSLVSNNPPTTLCPGGTACGNKSMFGRAGANGDTEFGDRTFIYGDLRSGDDIVNTAKVTVSGVKVKSLSVDATSPGEPFRSITPPGPGTCTGTPTGNLTVASNTTLTPESRCPVGSLGALTVNAGITLTLEPGIYYATTLNFGNASRLAVNGPVTIYFTGGTTGFGTDVIWGNAANPTWLKVVLKSTTTTNYATDWVNFTTGDRFTLYGGLYGKNTNIELSNNSVIYGSVIGRIVRLKAQTVIHYDQALGMQPVCDTGSYQVRRGTWREVLPSW
jgi:hypothetical protein